MGPTSDTQHSKETRVTPDTSRIATYIPGVQSLEVGSQVVLSSGYWIEATWRRVQNTACWEIFRWNEEFACSAQQLDRRVPPMWRFSAALC